MPPRRRRAPADSLPDAANHPHHPPRRTNRTAIAIAAILLLLLGTALFLSGIRYRHDPDYDTEWLTPPATSKSKKRPLKDDPHIRTICAAHAHLQTFSPSSPPTSLFALLDLSPLAPPFSSPLSLRPGTAEHAAVRTLVAAAWAGKSAAAGARWDEGTGGERVRSVVGRWGEGSPDWEKGWEDGWDDGWVEGVGPGEGGGVGGEMGGRDREEVMVYVYAAVVLLEAEAREVYLRRFLPEVGMKGRRAVGRLRDLCGSEVWRVVDA